MSEPNAASAPPNPSTAAPSSAAAAPVRETFVQNAVTFLNSPSVKSSTSLKKVEFLERKGLTTAEIAEAFRRVHPGSPSTTYLSEAEAQGKSASKYLAEKEPPPAPAAATSAMASTGDASSAGATVAAPASVTGTSSAPATAIAPPGGAIAYSAPTYAAAPAYPYGAAAPPPPPPPQPLSTGMIEVAPGLYAHPHQLANLQPQLVRLYGAGSTVPVPGGAPGAHGNLAPPPPPPPPPPPHAPARSPSIAQSAMWWLTRVGAAAGLVVGASHLYQRVQHGSSDGTGGWPTLSSLGGVVAPAGAGGAGALPLPSDPVTGPTTTSSGGSNPSSRGGKGVTAAAASTSAATAAAAARPDRFGLAELHDDASASARVSIVNSSDDEADMDRTEAAPASTTRARGSARTANSAMNRSRRSNSSRYVDEETPARADVRRPRSSAGRQSGRGARGSASMVPRTDAWGRTRLQYDDMERDVMPHLLDDDDNDGGADDYERYESADDVEGSDTGDYDFTDPSTALDSVDEEEFTPQNARRRRNARGGVRAPQNPWANARVAPTPRRGEFLGERRRAAVPGADVPGGQPAYVAGTPSAASTASATSAGAPAIASSSISKETEALRGEVGLLNTRIGDVSDQLRRQNRELQASITALQRSISALVPAAPGSAAALASTTEPTPVVAAASPVPFISPPAVGGASSSSAPTLTAGETPAAPAGSSFDLAAAQQAVSAACGELRSSTRDALPSRRLAVKAMLLFVSNILEHPEEERYRRINVQSSSYVQRIRGVSGAEAVLLRAGFVLRGSFIEFDKLEPEHPEAAARLDLLRFTQESLKAIDAIDERMSSFTHAREVPSVASTTPVSVSALRDASATPAPLSASPPAPAASPAVTTAAAPTSSTAGAAAASATSTSAVHSSAAASPSESPTMGDRPISIARQASIYSYNPTGAIADLLAGDDDGESADTSASFLSSLGSSGAPPRPGSFASANPTFGIPPAADPSSAPAAVAPVPSPPAATSTTEPAAEHPDA